MLTTKLPWNKLESGTGEDSATPKKSKEDADDFILDIKSASFVDLERIEAQNQRTDFSQRPLRIENRRVSIPSNRMSPVKKSWVDIYKPIVEHLKLHVKMDPRRCTVMLRTTRETIDQGALQKAADFVHAVALGFEVGDAIGLLRQDDLYIQSFEIKDFKTLSGEHSFRAIGRIVGKDGKMRFSIENASNTRIVVAGPKIHILGASQHVKMATESVKSLVQGAPPAKVYGNLQKLAARRKSRI